MDSSFRWNDEAKNAMPATDPIVILSYARTPMGSFQGASPAPSRPSSAPPRSARRSKRAGVAHEAIEKIYMGCVLPAGLGQAPARQAALKAGLPKHIEATTVNKMCGSGMQAAIMAADTIAAGSADIVIAGGMESMTNAPYLMTKHRGGARIGHDKIIDHMFFDGLEDAYEQGRLMGSFAEESARDYQFTREAQDDYAIASLTRAQAAQSAGASSARSSRSRSQAARARPSSTRTSSPPRATPRKIPTLKPAFAKDGTITAANASSISDGAAALVLTRQSVADKLGLKPVARIVGHAAHAHEPAKFTTAPVGAMTKALRAGRLDRRRGRPLRGQRSLRLRRHDRDARPRHPPRQDQRPRRRHRARATRSAPAAPASSPPCSRRWKRTAARRASPRLCIGGGEATAMAVELVD